MNNYTHSEYGTMKYRIACATVLLVGCAQDNVSPAPTPAPVPIEKCYLTDGQGNILTTDSGEKLTCD